MKLKNQHNKIIKFITNQASFSDLDDLGLCIQNLENEELFKTYIKTNYLVEYNMRRFDSEKILTKLSREMAKEKKAHRLQRIRRRIAYVAAAAVLMAIFSTIYFFGDVDFKDEIETIPTVVKSNTDAGTYKASLTLEDESVVILGKDSNYNSKNVKSSGGEIVYQSEKENSKTVVYNYLAVPRAGQFHIFLSDGTEVWLNSESKLKYPVQFIAGETRQVELLYGEAYFNVSPSALNNGSKFKVLNQSQEIEVLGTQFNLKAYSDEPNIYTTLVEGEVLVQSSSSNRTLKPNEQSILNVDYNILNVSNVNVYNEISWKDGIFSFQRKQLGDIMKVLSRWYDVKVEFVRPELKEVGFNGVLDKNQDITEILDLIKNYNAIEGYEIIGKTVVLK